MINSQTAVVCLVLGLVLSGFGAGYDLWQLWVPGGFLSGFGLAGVLSR